MLIKPESPAISVTVEMTPMIDIVFQLLVFFIMTFRIIIPEGDFNIKMPAFAPSAGTPEQETKRLTLKMTAKPGGELLRMTLANTIDLGNPKPISGFEELQGHILGIVGEASGPPSAAANAEIELDCDYNLHHRYVIDALTVIVAVKIEHVKLKPQKPRKDK